MSLQKEIDFMEELQNRFLNLHNTYVNFQWYDGHYYDASYMAGEVIDSLWRLRDLDK